MLEDLLLTETVVVALRVAAAGRTGDRPLATGDVLLALMRADVTGRWDYITLHTGDYDRLEDCQHPDPPGSTIGRWEGVSLTPALTAAFRYADELARGYNLLPLHAGVLALALVAEPDNGASRTLLSDADLTHVELVDLIHEHLVGVQLVESAIFPPWARSATLKPPREEQAARAAAGGIDCEENSDSFELVRLTIRRADEQLREKLAMVLLDDEEVLSEIEEKIEGLRDDPADLVIDRARDRFDTIHPMPSHIIAAAMVDPSEKIRRACWFLGVHPLEVAALASAHCFGDAPRRGLAGMAIMLLAVQYVLALGLTGAVIANAVETQQWLRLALVWAVWAGHPSASIRAGLVGTLLLGWLVGPIVGAVHLVIVALDLGIAHAERQAFWGQVGVRLRLNQFRRHLLRADGRLSRMQALRHRGIVVRRLAAS